MVLARRCPGAGRTGEIKGRTDKGDAILEIGHIHDLALGGPDDPSQMIALCPNCHAIKARGSTRGELRPVLCAAAKQRHERLAGTASPSAE